MDSLFRRRIAEFEEIYSGSPIGIAVLDRDLCFLQVNETLTTMTGLPAAAYAGKALGELFPEHELAVGKDFRAVFETGTATLDRQVHIAVPGRKGETRVVRESAFPIAAADGTVAAIIVTVKEITDELRAEKARRRIEERFEHAMQAAGIGAFEFDSTHAKVYWSGTLAALFGLAPRGRELSVDDDVMARLAPESRQVALDALERAVHGDGVLDVEYEVIHDDGSRHWLRSLGKRMAADATAITGVVIDITAARAREASVAREMAEKQILLDEASHRIKNNLQLVASLLGLQVSKAPPEVAGHLRQAMSRVHVVGVFHDLLFRLPDATQIDLSECLRLVCDVARDMAGSRRVDIDVDAPPARIGGDEALCIALVVNELVTNTVKYAFPDEGGGTVTVSARVDQDKVIVELADDGRGIAADAKPGLGTQLVNALCRQRKATLERLPAPRGAAFRLTVPFSFATKDEQQKTPVPV